MREESVLTAAPIEDDLVTEVTLRPQALEDFVGQAKLKERLMISLEAAATLGKPLDHVLLSGPPGLGKTT
ncbi:MAG: Holliday junction branch migration DNA helicase RuvB, partial [Acidimicrobiia bacterium]|nr:Holliday junction branch migration DNA helicase RuvB [Acidimicrobiia bacterium]